MRTLSTAQDKILSRPGHSVHLRIDIKDSGGTFRRWDNLLGHDWTVNAEWGEELDEPGLNATVELHYRRYVDSASPYTTGTRISGYLGVYRDLRIYTAVMADEAAAPTSGDWVLMFDGRIDKIEVNESTATLQCRDKITALIQDRWREADGLIATGTVAMETAIQTILNDSLGGSAPTLYTPTSPSFAIVEYNCEPQPLFEAVRDVYLVIGWDCRPKFRASSGLFELTLYDPDRAVASTMYTFSANRYRAIDGFGVDIADVRNVVELWYWDGSTTNDTKPLPKQVTVSDGTSVTAYGRRWMQIVEAQTGPIDTLGEATDMANAILADLKDPVADFSVTMPYFWPVEINDYYEFEPDGLRFSASQDLAVEGYRHRLDNEGGATTQLTVSGKPKSGRQVWLGREARPGQLATHNSLTPETPTVTATAGPIGVLVKTDWSTYGDFDMVQIHRSNTASFTPSASTLIGFLRGSRYYDQLADLDTTYYKAIGLDKTGNASVTSAEIATAATGLGRELMHPSLTRGVGVRATADQTLGSSPDRVEWDTVTWGDATLFTDGTDSIEAPYDGVYHVGVGIYPNVGAEFTSIRVRVYIDATTVVIDSGTRSLADEPVLLSSDVLVSAGDNLTVEIDYTGTTPTLESDTCYFTVRPTSVTP